MIRQPLFKSRTAFPDGFRLRGLDVKRIETFSDGVFAFAVTLLIVSLEVPKTFEDLLISMRGFLPFAICFTLLVTVWHEQHIFFRRYALDDRTTIFLNAALLFIVLFYVYPLKFLFTLIFSEEIYGTGKSPFTIALHQAPQLMVIYGAGFVSIYTIFLLMYLHARRARQRLDLTPLELFDTTTKIYAHLIMIAIGLGAIILAIVLPTRLAGTSGMFYIAIGPAFFIYYSKRSSKRKLIPI